MDKPAEPSIFVSLDRVRCCYPELGNVSWSGKVTCKKHIKGKVIVGHRFEGWAQSHAHRLARCTQTKM